MNKSHKLLDMLEWTPIVKTPTKYLNSGITTVDGIIWEKARFYDAILAELRIDSIPNAAMSKIILDKDNHVEFWLGNKRLVLLIVKIPNSKLLALYAFEFEDKRWNRVFIVDWIKPENKDREVFSSMHKSNWPSMVSIV